RLRPPSRHRRRHVAPLRAGRGARRRADSARRTPHRARHERTRRRPSHKPLKMKIRRDAYTSLYGPTTGDRVRLADTDLFLCVERDAAVYGEEVTFGGGKVIRDGQGQSQVTRAGGAPDLVITNAIVVDYTGIYKADIAVRDGRISAIG